MMDLTGQVALVTGATRGIGKAIAQTLAANGAKVIGTATSAAGVSSITEYLGENGRGIILNVTDNASIADLLADISKNEGSISILVNNAGITRDQLLMRMKDSDWDEILQTNLTSVFKLSKAVMRPMMKAHYGRIITITSIVGVMGNAGQANYAAAKAGVIGFSKSMAREIGSRGITVNCVAPGFIDTDMTKDLPDNIKTAMLAQIPVGRLGDAKEIAHAVAFLASNSAGYITGETIHVNGGMLMV